MKLRFPDFLILTNSPFLTRQQRIQTSLIAYAANTLFALFISITITMVLWSVPACARDRTNIDVGVGVNLGAPLFGGTYTSPVPVIVEQRTNVIPPLPIYEAPRPLDVGPRYNHGPNLNCAYGNRPFRIMDDYNRVVGWVCPP